MAEKHEQLKKKIEAGAGLTLDEGYEVLRQRRQVNKETRQAQDRKEFRTHYSKVDKAPEKARHKFMEYVTNWLKKENPLYFYVLRLRMEGLSLKVIASELSKKKNMNITANQISAYEVQAIRAVKERIEKVKRVGIPIFEKGANASENLGIVS